jgi:hypothetical protein
MENNIIFQNIAVTMKQLVLIMALFAISLCAVNLHAQTIKDLELQNKDLIKTLKNQQGMKKVEIKMENDGYWYFLLTAKTKLIGVADKGGKVIIPPDNTEISYYPPMEDGYVNAQFIDQNGVKGEIPLYHKKCMSVFLAKRQNNRQLANLYSTNGVLLRGNITETISYIPGYFILGADKISFYQGSNHVKFISVSDGYPESTIGLIAVDGIELLKPMYSDLVIYKDNSCIYEQNIDNITHKGGFLLSKPTFKIPCVFYSIMYHDYDGKWTIQRNSNSNSEIYNPANNYTIQYRDLGEEYYEKGDYDHVIDFYAKNGISAPWAKFFTGISLIQKAYRNTIIANDKSKSIEENTVSLSHDESFDLVLATEQYKTAIQLLSAYIKEDTVFKQKALESKDIALSWMGELPNVQIRYNKALQLLQQRNERARLAEIQSQNEAQQRQNEIMTAILNGFISGLSHTKNQGNYSSKSVGGGSTSSAARNSSSSTNSNSSNSNAKLLALWKDKRADAQQHYQAAAKEYSRNPNPLTKKNLNDCADILRTCEENVAKYQ